MFKKISLFILITLVIPFIVMAADPLQQGSSPPAPQSVVSGEIDNPLKANDFTTLIKGIIKWLARIGELIAVIMIIYAGFLFMTSGGSEDKVTTARKTLTWAAIGLAVLIIGEGWVYVVKDLIQTK